MYLLIFAINIIVFILLNFKQVKKAKHIAIFLLIIFTIGMGLRKNVGLDFPVYEYNYEIRYYSMTFKEPLWSLIFLIFSYFNADFSIVVLTIQALTSLFLYLGLKRYKLSDGVIAASICVYTLTFGIDFLNLMRQGLAIAIFFFAYSYLRDKNYKKYIIFSIISICIHFSMLLIVVLSVMFQITNFRKYLKYILHYKIMIIGIILTYIFVYFNLSSKILDLVAEIIPIYSKYADSEFLQTMSNNIFSPIVFIKVVIVIISIYYLNKKSKNFELILLFSYIGTIFNILSISTYMYDRIGIMFSFFNILTIPVFIERVKRTESKKIGYLTNVILVVYCMIFYLNVFLYADVNMLNYQFYYNF